MVKHHFSALLLSALLLSAGAMAAPDNVIKPTRGTIDAVNANSLDITTRQGVKL